MTDSQTKQAAEFTRILELALNARTAEEQRSQARPLDWAHTLDAEIQSALDKLLNSPAYVPIGRIAQVYAEEGPAAHDRGREFDRFLAEELTFSPDLSVEELRRLRRQFAIYNHPDRVDASERERATRRMALVNVLVDRALRERGASPTG